MIKAIIFDMDGTLYPMEWADSKTGTMYAAVKNRCYTFISDRLGMNVIKAKELWNDLAKRYNGHVSIALEKEFGIDRKKYFDYTWDINPADFVRDKYNAREVLSTIDKKIILLSLAPEIWVNKVLKHLNIDDLFADIYNGEGDVRKPYPEAFLRCLRKYSISPHEAMMVGDLEEDDMLTPFRLGMITVSIPQKLPSAKHCINDLYGLKDIIRRTDDKND
jgi:FMN phosphatase YigB (HAD superfamily)